MVHHKFVITAALILMIFQNSCSNQTAESLEESESLLGATDSSELYAFFKDKISSSWDYSATNDSVAFEFDEYGLPKSRSEIKKLGSKSIHLSIEYAYNISDSTETVKHLQQYGGGHSLTVIRKFGTNGQILWKEEVDIHHNHRRTFYNENGLIDSVQTIP